MGKNSHATRRIGARLAALAAAAAAPLAGAARADEAPAPRPYAPAAVQYLSLGASAAIAFETSSEGSALARITRQQTGSTDAEPPRPILASLSFTAPAPVLQRAVLRSGPARVTTAEPNVFGSMAIPVRQTALQERWRRVAHARAPESRQWNEIVAEAAELPLHERLMRVNAWVNEALVFEDDIRGYRARDYWATASESLARGRGDCEDYAIAKMQLLQAAGVPRADLYLVIVKDLVRRSDHAVLAVRADDEYWILDNSTDLVLPADAVADYRPVVTYSAERAWVHGYERRPDVMLASSASLRPAGAPR